MVILFSTRASRKNSCNKRSKRILGDNPWAVANLRTQVSNFSEFLLRMNFSEFTLHSEYNESGCNGLSSLTISDEEP